MTDVTVRRFGRLPITAALAPPLALLLLALAAGTTMGRSAGTLTAPSVSPNVAVAGATVSFGVTFTDPAGAAPRSVSVAIGYDWKAMTGAGSDYTRGVRFTVAATPGVGHYQIWFRSDDADGHLVYVRGSDLTIEPAPSPTPTRSPTVTRSPTPAPTATPTRSPSPTRTPSPTATRPPELTPRPTSGTPRPVPIATVHASAPSAGSTSTKAAGPVASSGPGKGDSPSAGVAGLAGGRSGSTPVSGPSAAGSATAAVSPSSSPTDISAGTVLSGPAGYELTYGISRGGIATGVPAALFSSKDLPLQELMARLAPTIATACAGTAAWAAFAFLGRRRRNDDESDDGLLAAAAASGLEADAATGLEVDESLLPRWRRPSLQQVRRTDPLRATAEAPHLSFESAGVVPLEDYERRHIGYRLVRLLDSPDELRSTEIGILDQGDEVQLLERHGAYWLVLCPDGRQGWVHRMTLADCVPAAELAAEPELMPQDGAVEYEMPGIEAYAEEPGTDGLLEAYMSARRDVLKTMAGEPGANEASGEAPAFCTFEAATFAVPAAEVEASLRPIEEPASAAAPSQTPVETPAAKPEHAGERYSARKSGGSRKAATASRPGTKSRRPSR
jgi:hypothetical protein